MNWKWINNNNPAATQWFCIKLSVTLSWLGMLLPMVYCCPDSPIPVGICRLINLDFLFGSIGGHILAIVLLAIGTLYLLEKWMPFTTFCWFGLCVIIISHHESNGYYFRGALLSAIMGAQFIAYLIAAFNKSFNLTLYRKQYCLQLIAASYTLSAITKLQVSGLSWIENAPLFSLQILKSHAFAFFTDGLPAHIEQGTQIARLAFEHRELIMSLFAATLLLEACCFIAVFDEKLCLIYGFLLLLMHAGIFMTSSILIVGIIFPMIIFFINPLYYIQFYFAKVIKGTGQ